jgi:hypothetical protein
MFKSIHAKLISAVAVVALISPAASYAVWTTDGGALGAQPIHTQQQRQLDQLQRNVQKQFASAGGWHLAVPAAAAQGQQGFQLGDAGIGAAGMVALLGAGALTAGTTRRRRAIG